MSFLSEFREFAIKGNMVDLAVAVIIGGAFGKIVDSLVKDVLMPIIGLFLGGINFTGLFVNLSSQHYDTLDAAEKAHAAILRYGSFLQAVVDFLIIAFVVFLMIRLLGKLHKRVPAAPQAPPEEVILLRDIRDALKGVRH